MIEIATMEILERSALADDKARALAWNPDGDVIAAPGPEGDVELYRMARNEIKAKIKDLLQKDEIKNL